MFTIRSLTRLRLAPVAFLVTVLTLLLGASQAFAANDPALTLAVNQPAHVLYGSQVPVTLTAANPAGQGYGYNLSLSYTLPVGVTYVPGSSTSTAGATGDPTIDTNAGGGETLIWSNLSDLSPNSSFPISFKLAVNQADYDVGGAAPGTSGSFTGTAQAFASTDPRYVPKFNADGTPNGPSSTSFTGESSATPATTSVEAIQIKKSGPATLLRGVHDHQGTYDLTVTNNSVNPTDSVTVTDYLPADLEFLGCGSEGVDHTTNAEGTNPGSTDEYPGSGPIDVTSVSGCVTPTSVQTVDTTPPMDDANGNPLPAGVYTEVTWTLNNMTPGQVETIPYVAAVPIRENTLNWAASTTGTSTTTTAPSTTNGDQTANLDNNNGGETYHNEPIVNGSEVTGDYQDPADSNASIPTSDTSVLSGVAKDIIIGKTVSSPTLQQGAIPTYTLTVSTSEYRFYNNLTVTDTLPNGQCPLDKVGGQDFEAQAGSGDDDCQPVAGHAPSSEYASATEQVGSGGTISDGDYALSWNSSTDAQLAQIPVNGTVTITFPAKTLRYYQKNGEDDTSTPILSGDSITNHAGVSGTDDVRCAGGSGPEDCVGGTQISHDATTSNGTTDQTVGTDAASASQAAPEPTIEKEVATSLPADGKCSDATYQTTLATYGPGDEVCWELTVNFPAGTDTSVSTLNDFLPDGLSVISGSETATASNTVAFSVAESTSAPQLAFTLCPSGSGTGACGGTAVGDVSPGGQTFQVTFASTEGSPSGHLSGDVQGNLMKFSSVNTPGVSYPLRSAADFQFSVPTLGLDKTITSVNTVTEPSNTKNATVTGGDAVTYQLAVSNTGTADATDADIWEDLPTGESCSDVVADPSEYVCNPGSSGSPDYLVFSPITVAAGKTQDLSFTVDVPTGADEPSPGQSLTDTAGVVSYQSTDNLGNTETYIPADNLDSAYSGDANAPEANSSATVTMTGATITKGAASTVHEVSTADATIGEPIAYTVTTTLPAGTTLYGSPTITDDVPSTVSVNGSTVTATLDGHTLPYDGVTVAASGNNIVIDLGTTYPVNTGGDTIALSFDASVLDQNANVRGDQITNTATLAWKDSGGTAASVSSKATTTVVEPDLKLAKTDNATGHVVSPGQTVKFTVTASDSTSLGSTSPAHDVAVTDVVPAGVTVLNTGGNPAQTGDTVSTSGGGGTFNATTDTITWPDIGTVAPGASTALTYNATVNNDPVSGTTMTNTASGTTDSLAAGTAGERTASSTTNTGYTASASDTIKVAGPTIAKTATPTSGEPGQQVSYQATVTLPANTLFNDTTILDTLPKGIVFDAYGSYTCSFSPTCTVTSEGSTVNANGTTSIGFFAGELGPFTTSQTITVNYTAHVGTIAGVDVNAATLTNTATVSTDTTQKVTTAPTSPPASSTFSNTSTAAKAPVTVIEPNLGIAKAVADGNGTPSSSAKAAQGDTLTYTVTVTNKGTAPAYNVDVQDTPPSSLSDITPVQNASDVTQNWTSSNPELKWTVPGPIAAGGTVTFTYTAVVPVGDTDQEAINNTASIPSYTSQPGANTNGRTYTNDPSSSAVVTVQAPVLAITKTPVSPTADAGSGDSYNVVVTNNGHATTGTTPAQQIVVTDTVPAGMNYAAGTATGTPNTITEASDVAQPNGSSVVSWDIGNLAPAASETISLPVTFPANTASGTKLTNSASADSPLAPTPVSAHGTITVNTAADLEAIKSVATTPIPAGGQDTYTLQAKNLGPSDAQTVTLTDPLPSSETFVSADPGCSYSAGTNTVTCSAGTVADGATATYHVTVAVSPTVTGPISNTLTVASTTPDPNPANNTATIAPDSISQADVSITKSADKIQYNGGDTVTYTLTASNSGPATAASVVITDPLPSAVNFKSASSGCTDASNTVTCAAGSIPAGATKTYTVTATADGTAPGAASGNAAQMSATKVEQDVTLTPGQTATYDLSCGSGDYITDGDANVIEVDQGTGTLASVEILKSFATSTHTYEFTLDNTATGNAQVQLYGVCIPNITGADENGNTHPIIEGNQVTKTETLSQGDHTITVDVGNADVPTAPSFEFLDGVGTVQGSEGSSNSSVWTYTVDVTTPSATIEVGSTPLQVQPGTGGSGYTEDLQFTTVSEPVSVAANTSETVPTLACPEIDNGSGNHYSSEGIEATYNLPDGLLMLGSQPDPVDRVFQLDNTTNQTLNGTVDLLCMSTRTGAEVDYLGPVVNTASISEVNIDPNSSNNSGAAAIRIDRAPGSGAVINNASSGTPASGGNSSSGTPSSGGSSSGGSSSSSSSASSSSSVPASGTPSSSSNAVSAAPNVVQRTVSVTANKATLTVTCAAASCEGSAAVLAPVGKHGELVQVASVRYELAKGKTEKLVLHFRRGVKLTKKERRKLTLVLTPKGGKAKRIKLA